jgi:hypothetical protein
LGIAYILRLTSSWIGVLPLIIGLLHFKRLNSPLKVIWAYCLLSVVSEQIIFFLWKHHINNMPFFHVFTVLEFLLFYLFFKLELGNSFNKPYIKLIAIAFPIFCLLNAVFFQNILEINTNTRPMEAAILIFFTGRGMFLSLTSNNTSTFVFNYFVWVCGALLIYFCGSFVLFIITKFLNHSNMSAYKIGWSYHAILNIIFYCFFSIAIWKHPKT